MTFSELRAAISAHMNRNFTDAQLRLFVSLAEDDIRNQVRVRVQTNSATGTTVDNYITAPADLMEIRSLTMDDRLMRYVEPGQFTDYIDAEARGVYTILGDYIYVSDPVGTDYELVYWAEFPRLAADGDGNWLLTHASNVYLFAGCKQASIFMKDVESASAYDTVWKEAVAILNGREGAATIGGQMRRMPRVTV